MVQQLTSESKHHINLSGDLEDELCVTPTDNSMARADIHGSLVEFNK
jgi:hypothetical protein